MTAPAVVVVSGHMVDAPGREVPRFPPEQVPRVTDEVREVLDGWEVGAATTVVTGGARGADLIVAEEAVERGARVVLCLALPPDQFEEGSVALPGSDWSDRFRRLLDQAEVRVFEGGVPGDDELYARTNRWMLEVARRIDEPNAILVWNGQRGDGPGGTEDFARQLGITSPVPERARVIDPTPRAYEARQRSPAPKKLLALDGGGIRGALTLEILAVLEQQLRNRAADTSIVLSDYFDYIGGTSTGAIIAAGLARGYPVSELSAKYASLGRVIFEKRAFHRRFRSTYKHERLVAELETMFGRETTLGDPATRSLLLVVLHNTKTDSAWPLSNCTQAKYNQADRYLLPVPDRNLDFRLVDVLRGSTAAPVYFQPQQLKIGTESFLFQDGGITPFNNPAFLMYLMATVSAYRLAWPTGENQLLLVSVGTGATAAVHPTLRVPQVHLVFNARNLPSVFMNGASVGQDLLCRTNGRCRYGQVLDREVESLVGAALPRDPAFAYLRYNADLSDEALGKLGLSFRKAARLRRLDAVEHVDGLRRLGKAAGEQIDVDTHFRGFL